jgi:hypothetical protein
MTAPTRYYASTMTVADLNATVAMLRSRFEAILDAHRLLLDYGVETQTADVYDRLDAIKAEAHEIACRLAHLGHEHDASAATCGWLITPGRKKSRP